MKITTFYFILISICISFILNAEEKKKLYKWTDAQGNVHFSDQPEKGAEEIEMKLAPVTKLSPIKNPSTSTPTKQADSQANKKIEGEYTSLSFSNLTDDSIIRNNSNSVALVASIQPELAEGHSLRFFLDGALITTDDGATSVTAEGIELGEHSASFIIVDKQGLQLKASETVHFQLLNRVNPQIKQNQQASQN